MDSLILLQKIPRWHKGGIVIGWFHGCAVLERYGGMEKKMAVFEDFLKLDIRVGEIIRAEPFPQAKKPAYKLTVDFGAEIGVKKSSAQITAFYTPEELNGRQVLGVVNFPPRRIAGFDSEVLVLGVYTGQGVVLISPDRPVEKGDKLG
jgi:tRNA-binding protein